jgi:hypothetical protein
MRRILASVHCPWICGCAGLGLAMWIALLAAAEPPKAPDPMVPELKLDETTTVVLDTARNGMAAKTKLTATPSQPNYYLKPVIDGIRERKDMGWQDCAWASEEDDAPHGLEIALAKPLSGGRFQITWAYDINNDEGGRWWISRNYSIQIKSKAADPWTTVVDVRNNQSTIGSYPLPDQSFAFLRIVQWPGGGHPLRPNIMWLGQVEFTD